MFLAVQDCKPILKQLFLLFQIGSYQPSADQRIEDEEETEEHPINFEGLEGQIESGLNEGFISEHD